MVVNMFAKTILNGFHSFYTLTVTLSQCRDPHFVLFICIDFIMLLFLYCFLQMYLCLFLPCPWLLACISTTLCCFLHQRKDPMNISSSISCMHISLPFKSMLPLVFYLELFLFRVPVLKFCLFVA